MSTRRSTMATLSARHRDKSDGILVRFARRAVLSRLKMLEHGQIVISESGTRHTFGSTCDQFPEPVRVYVDSPAFYTDIAFGGAIGSGEAYIHGRWRCERLQAALQILLHNRPALEKVDSGAAVLARPLTKLLHLMNRNTRKGSRKNIAAHYDLGNDFYSLWLDPSMMYSSAFFEKPNSTLYEASIAKLDRICRKLRLSAGDSVIEIGSGWGGFAMHAARHYGCQVTTTTISRQQYDHARHAIAKAGLEDRITLLLSDYRDLEGQFDKLVSIEMIEAVGHEYHPVFFRKCCELLKADGEMLLQAITIADQRYDQYKNSVDFIKRYVFPGGCLTSVTDMSRVMTEHTDLCVHHLEDIGIHYAETLRRWNERFFSRLDDVRALGYSEEFIRLWEFYLCYCESAFRERATGDVQMHILRPGARPPAPDESFSQAG